MFLQIYKFELRYNLHRIAPYVFFLVLALMAFQDASNVSPTRTIITTHGQIVHNAPLTLARLMMVLSIFCGLITIVFAGTSVVRDFERQTHSFFFTSPISKMGYLAGRFLGGFTVVLFIFSGVILGNVIGCLTIDSQYVGPFRFIAFIQAYLLVALPNLLLLGLVFFTFASLTRNMIATYVVGIVSLALYMFMQSSLGDVENLSLRAMLDPFGFVAMEELTKFWTVAELNKNLLPVNGLFLWNRFLWLSVSAIVFLLLYARFDFEFIKRQRRKTSSSEDPESFGIRSLKPLPPATQSFVIRIHLGQVWLLARSEGWRIIRHPAFIALTFLGMMQAYGNFVENAGPGGSNVYPLTSWYLNWTTELFGYMIPITVFFAGVLAWRESDFHTDEIFDSMPYPDWAPFMAKLGALFLIQGVFILAVFGTGIFAQAVIFGYTDFELGLYVKALFGIELLNYWHMAIVALLIQTLVNNKYLGFFLSAGYFILDFALYTGFEVTNFLHRFGWLPEYIYSNLNGFGHFAEPLLWYRLYWALLAVVLLLLTVVIWRRGKEQRFRLRLRAARYRAAPRHLLIAGMAALGFIATGSFIYYNIKILNPYVTADRDIENRVNYEKKYGQFVYLAQPSIEHIEVAVDIYPNERNVYIKGRYRLRNEHAVPIDTVHLRLSPLRISRINRFGIVQGSETVYDDTTLGYYILRLTQPLDPGQSVNLQFDLEAVAKGFTDITPRNEVVGNGTYLDNFPFSPPYYFPAVGYSIFNEIQNPQIRREYGLPQKSLPAPLEDHRALEYSFTNWVTLDVTVSTSKEQIAVVNGDLLKQWYDHDRNYYRYVVDSPMNNGMVILSGRYEVARSRYKDIAIEVYHHPDHAYNVQNMIRGVEVAFDYCTQNFAPYPYDVVRIVEVPDYGIIGGNARSQPMIFTWTENGGFISNLEDENALDVVFSTTTHEMAHQWWGHMVKGANVQGLGVMAETLSEWVRIMCMHREYGAEKTRELLRNSMQQYLAGRSHQVIDEPVLMRAGSEPYLNYGKGGVAMYALADYIGENAVNRALRKLVDRFAFAKAPYPTTKDLLHELRVVTPDSLQFVLTDLFETITLYYNRAESAVYKELDDGRYEIELTVLAKKMRADGKGNENEIETCSYVDIGVFDEDDNELHLSKEKFESPRKTLRIVVAQRPHKAAIDPYAKLIEKNQDDNKIKVSYNSKGLLSRK